MNGLDLALIAIVGLSTVFAFVRGAVREVIALATWVVALVVAIACAGPAARMIAWPGPTPFAKQVLAFAGILIVVMIAGAVVAWLLSGVVRAIGLGFVDRLLGAAFGAARGVVLLLVFALIAGVTALPGRDWWQNATLGRPLAEAALSLRPYLPRAWAERLHFGAAGTGSACRGGRTAVALAGEHGSCVES